jgi:hypothetical protein
MPGRVTAGLTALRGTGALAIVLLLWNPTATRDAPDAGQRLVLLDASLSMAGLPGDSAPPGWRRALDTARVIAGDGVIWRFGDVVSSFDSTAPGDGASRLGPALTAAAARGGEVTVVTDGVISDVASLPTDLRRRPRVVVLPRAPFSDAFVAAVSGNRRISAGDTLTIGVSYGAAGTSSTAPTRDRNARIELRLGDRVLTHRQVNLPDSGVTTTELTVPAARLPAGWSVLDVVLVPSRADVEPRDDARSLVVHVGPQPAVVVLAAPPDWDARFLARTLADVARVPLRTFVEAVPPAGGGWRDGVSLAAVGPAVVQRAVDSARLVVLLGQPRRLATLRLPPRVATLAWPTAAPGAREGDWYVDPPPGSPIAGALAGVRWDSLPPLTAVAELDLDSTSIPVLGARLARRGGAQAVLVLFERDGRRQAAVAGRGLWRWSFRGGSAAEAYRALVAATADWLLGGAEGGRERAVPMAHEVAAGLALEWQWTGAGAANNLVIDLQAAGGTIIDTLRFDAQGRASLRLPTGAYRYALRGGNERGVVVVERYSDEWRPAAATVTEQAGLPGGGSESSELRDRWWLFVVAIGAFAAEWAWRRRAGLP